MIHFQQITEELLEFVLEVLNSNPDYNILENGSPFRSMEEVRGEFLNETTNSYLILLENRHIGVIDFLKNNPKDNCPWIGLLMIHGDYHAMGYGQRAYLAFEEKLKRQQFDRVRIGILQDNIKAKSYWKALGFTFYRNSEWEGKIVECFEKQLDVSI